MAKMVVRNIFDATVDEGIDCREVDPKTGEYVYRTLTKQSEKDACDINQIMARYERTGVLPENMRGDPRFGDFSSVPTFLEAQLVVARANEQFAALDARMRDRFENSPVKFLEFCENPKNVDEMVKMGLATAKAGAKVPSGAPDTGAKESSKGDSAGSAGGPKA